MLPSLLDIANELDALGLHKEANALDRILQKKADVLMYKEKPFLAQLARIMMALERYKSGERVKESITFPNSDVNLFGLTKQAAVEKIQKHLKMFIDQFLVPNLDRKYKGTKYEDQYRQFVAEVYDLYQTLEGLFAHRSEQQSIREGLSAIEQVKRMIGQLIVYVRTRESSKGVEQESEINLRQGLQILNKLEMAVKQIDEKTIKDSIHDLLEIFPRKGNSSTSRVVIDAYNSENIPFVRQSVIEEEAKNRTSLELIPELETAESSYKRYNQEIAKKKDIVGRTEDLEKRLQRLKEEAAKYDFKTKMIEKYRGEFEIKVKTEPFTYEPPRRVSHIKNKYRRYEVIAGDLSNLQKWLEQYKKRSDLDQVVSFSNWISKFNDASAANKAFTTTEANIADLKMEAENDLRAAEDARDFVEERELTPLRREWGDIKDQVVWDMWHNQYITRLIQTLNYVLAPETRGQTTSEEAFDRALGGFNKVLNYKI